MKRLLLCFALVSQTLFAIPARKDVPEEYRWNLAALYSSHDAWQQELDAVVTSNTSPYFPQLTLHKGSLHSSSQAVLETLTTFHSFTRKLEKLYIYANLSHNEDMAEPKAKARLGKIEQIYHHLIQESSWINPELFSLTDARFQEYINDPLLAEYRLYLERLYKQKSHVRTAGEEEILAQAMSVLNSSSGAFGALNNADFKFGSVLDSEGKAHELTSSTYNNLEQSSDRTLRKNAFLALSGKYQEHENSITELFAGNLKAHRFMAQARRYSTCLEAALSPNNIDVDVYHNLIKAVHERVDLLHRYLKLKKQILALDELHTYDLYVPLVKPATSTYPFKEAVELVFEAVKPLGPDYVASAKNGLIHERWVDVYENQNKRSGGYSSGCYDTMPYISMNYTDSLRDVYTLVHETGHSMHSYYSKKHQPYLYADYTIFVAEVASIFNETLMCHMLLSRAETKKERAYLLNQALEDITASIYRQVMYAEFELFAHTAVEQNIPVTPSLLNDKYLDLVRYYFGPELAVDPEIGISWARVPHFYFNFYVYQYATGTSAALALADSVIKGDEAAKERYLEFLRSGSSEYPLDLLAKAGCDMRTTAPIHKALDTFEAYLNEFEQLMKD